MLMKRVEKLTKQKASEKRQKKSERQRERERWKRSFPCHILITMVRRTVWHRKVIDLYVLVLDVATNEITNS
jgi:hypothetical protein